MFSFSRMPLMSGYDSPMAANFSLLNCTILLYSSVSAVNVFRASCASKYACTSAATDFELALASS